MVVLVTGGAGYLGSKVTGRLLSKGHKVLVLDNLLFGGESLLHFIGHPNIALVKEDIRDEAAVDLIMQGHKPDAVVHLAAIVGDPACAKDLKLAHDVNVNGSRVLFEACIRRKVNKVIFASTCSNYGRMTRLYAEQKGIEEGANDYINEDGDLNPISAYAKHKVKVENLLKETYNLNYTILRFATLYGVSPRMRFDLTVNQFVMEALVDRKLSVYGENFYRPYLHVMDAANVVAQILVYPFGHTENSIWNVGRNDENYTKKDIVEKIRSYLGKSLFEVEYVHKAEDPRDYTVDFTKIKDAIGFRPAFNVNFGIHEVAAAVMGAISNPKDPKWRNS
jgi:nucleoside-diphosphate-sugar epimerase